MSTKFMWESFFQIGCSCMEIFVHWHTHDSLEVSDSFIDAMIRPWDHSEGFLPIFEIGTRGQKLSLINIKKFMVFMNLWKR